MKLSLSTMDYIRNAIRTAKLLDIDNIVLDADSVRGAVVQEGIYIIQRDLPQFEFESICISRLNILESRLSLMDGTDYEINTEDTTKESKDGPSTFVYKLLFNNSNTEVDFKCANPMLNKAPRKLKDPVAVSFTLDENTVRLLSRAQNAVKSESISFMNKGDKVYCKFNDEQGDTFKHMVDVAMVKTADCVDDKFAYSFKTKVLVPIFKQCLDNIMNSAKETDVEIAVLPKITINLTTRGILNTIVNGMNIYVTHEV